MLVSCIGRAFKNDADHLGNHVSGSAHNDGIANAHVFARYFVLIVQGGVGNGNATDEYRLQAGNRGYCTGAPDLYINGFDNGQCFFGRKFVGNGPARRA